MIQQLISTKTASILCLSPLLSTLLTSVRSIIHALWFLVHDLICVIPTMAARRVYLTLPMATICSIQMIWSVFPPAPMCSKSQALLVPQYHLFNSQWRWLTHAQSNCQNRSLLLSRISLSWIQRAILALPRNPIVWQCPCWSPLMHGLTVACSLSNSFSKMALLWILTSFHFPQMGLASDSYESWQSITIISVNTI